MGHLGTRKMGEVLTPALALLLQPYIPSPTLMRGPTRLRSLNYLRMTLSPNHTDIWIT